MTIFEWGDENYLRSFTLLASRRSGCGRLLRLSDEWRNEGILDGGGVDAVVVMFLGNPAAFLPKPIR